MSKSRGALALSLFYAHFSVLRGCWVFPELLWAPWSQVEVEVRVRIKGGGTCATLSHRWSSLAQRTSCSPPALLPEGILEATGFRGEDAHFGPVATQMQEHQHSHGPLLPPAPIPGVPDPQQPGSRRMWLPHCTTQAVK